MAAERTRAPRRIALGCCPTPLHELKNFGQALGGGKRLWIKREDLIGVGLGGNKVRKMEYLLAEALDEGCDGVEPGGRSRSHQPLAVAACAVKAGLEPHIVYTNENETVSGSLGQLIGVREHFADEEARTNMMRDIRNVAAELTNAGRKPYIIKPGVSSPLSALGYVDCMEELFAQAAEKGISFGHVVCCGGTGNMYAGVVLGTKLFSPETKAVTVSIGRRFSHKPTLLKQALRAAELGGYDAALSEDDFEVHFSCGKGAGFPTVKGREAMEALASSEGIFLDPYYTGKAMAGLLELNAEGAFADGENIAFIHSGGGSALLNSL